MNIIGIDFGGTKIAVSLGDTEGRVRGGVRLDNRNSKPEVILPGIVRAIEKLTADAGLAAGDIGCFGISTPSPADIPNGAVRVEEMLNYFRYDYAAPDDGKRFGVTAQIGDCPWNADAKLLMLGVRAADAPEKLFAVTCKKSGSLTSSAISNFSVANFTVPV